MKYRREIYEKTLVSLAELRKSMKEDETQVLDFIAEAVAEKGDRDWPVPPEPLTLDELRQMDEQPVWIVEHPDWGHWELSADAEDYIAERDQDFYGLKHNDPAGRYGLHMLGWLAYRRPPEGEEGAQHAT